MFKIRLFIYIHTTFRPTVKISFSTYSKSKSVMKTHKFILA